tara:strand:- start:220 stop:1755 length:1536 start_codon:yes stop_codon:yes gene_type:complete
MKDDLNIYCFGSIPIPGATIYLYDFLKKDEEGGVQLKAHELTSKLKNITNIKTSNYLEVSSFADGAYPFYTNIDHNKKVRNLYFELNNSCGWGSTMFFSRKERLEEERKARPTLPKDFQMDMTIPPAVAIKFDSRNREYYYPWRWFNEIDGKNFKLQKKSKKENIFDLEISSSILVFDDTGSLDRLSEQNIDKDKLHKEALKKEKFYGCDDGLSFERILVPIENGNYPVNIHFVDKNDEELSEDLQSESKMHEGTKPIYPIISINNIEGCYLTKDKEGKLIFVKKDEKKLSDYLTNQIKKKSKKIKLCQLDLENLSSLNFIKQLKFNIDVLELHGLRNIEDWSPLLKLKNVNLINFTRCNLNLADKATLSVLKKINKDIRIILDFEEIRLNTKNIELKGKDGQNFYGELDKNSVANGYGILTLSDGTRYVGGFKNFQYHGFGTLTLPSGSIYIGEFKNGMEEGKAKFYSAQGFIYDGPFKNNQYHGKGKMIFNGVTANVEFNEGIEVEQKS